MAAASPSSAHAEASESGSEAVGQPSPCLGEAKRFLSRTLNSKRDTSVGRGALFVSRLNQVRSARLTALPRPATSFIFVPMIGLNAIRGEIRTKPKTMDGASLKLEQFLPYQLNVLAALVSEALSRIYARRYRIGIPEWRMLVTLGQFGAMTGKAISAHTHMHKTKVSRAVAILEKRKLLARRVNRADMRESFLSLTAAGRVVYAELAPHALDFARRLTEILTPADRDAFHCALQKITDRSAQLVAAAIAQSAAKKNLRDT